MEVVDKNAWVNFYKNTLFSHIAEALLHKDFITI